MFKFYKEVEFQTLLKVSKNTQFFTKKNNFCDFLFVFLKNYLFSKYRLFLGEGDCPDCSTHFNSKFKISTWISVVSPLGVAFVGFGSEKDLDQAYGRNKNFLGGKRIFLKKTQTELTTEEVKEDVPRPWELKQVG